MAQPAERSRHGQRCIAWRRIEPIHHTETIMNAHLQRLSALGLISALALAPTARAQNPATPARRAADTIGVPLTVDEAVARAVRGSQEVRLARATVDLAETQVTAARSAALPQLDAVVNYTRTFASPFGGGGGFTLPDSLRFEP